VSVLDKLGIRARVLLLLILVTVPFGALLVGNAVEQYRLLKRGVGEQTLQLARLAANNQYEVVEQSRRLLEALATDARIQAGNWPGCNAMLADLLTHFQGSHSNFVVADTGGNVVCSGAPLRENVNIADIKDFQEVIATRRFVVGDLVLARTTATWVVLLRAPVVGAGDRMIATVSAPVPVERFASAASTLSLPAHGELVIVDRGGRIIAHRPNSQWRGKAAADTPIVRAMLDRREGVLEVAGMDGIPRVYGFAAAGPDGRSGIHVAIGVPWEAMASLIDRELLTDLGVVIAVVAGVLAIALYASYRFVSGNLMVILEAANRIRTGQLSARTGLRGREDELTRIGETFDLMAQALQEREADLQKALHESHELAITDPLTGLYNRRYLWDLLKRELQKANRTGKPISAIMVDIDHFKRFNDAWGHEAGDFVLARVADALRENVRGSDIACRYGGEEMAVILPEATLEVAVERAETIRQCIAAKRLAHNGNALDTVTSSLGVAVYPQHGADAEALLRAADAALYEAKKAGRNRVAVASPKAIPVETASQERH
jgi:diguanylate cyclase (GGDEF)-like protein